MSPCSTPKASWRTLARGARQFVVQEALVLRGIEGALVDAEHEGQVHALGGRRDQHPARACLEVQGAAGAVGELAGRLEHHVDAQRLPRQPGRILLAQHLDRAAVHGELAVGGMPGARPGAVDRVVAQQVGQGRGVGEVVDRDEFERGTALDGGADHLAADAAEPVDADAKAHDGWLRGGGRRCTWQRGRRIGGLLGGREAMGNAPSRRMSGA